MTPEQRAFMDEHHPDHHLKFNNTKNIWLVEAYGTSHQFKSTDYKGPDKAKAAAVVFRDSLPSNAFDWDYRLVEQVKSDVVGVNRVYERG